MVRQRARVILVVVGCWCPAAATGRWQGPLREPAGGTVTGGRSDPTVGRRGGWLWLALIILPIY